MRYRTSSLRYASVYIVSLPIQTGPYTKAKPQEKGRLGAILHHYCTPNTPMSSLENSAMCRFISARVTVVSEPYGYHKGATQHHCQPFERLLCALDPDVPDDIGKMQMRNTGEATKECSKALYAHNMSQEN